MKTAILLAATALLAGCVSEVAGPMGERLTGEALAARLAGHTVVLRPDGGAPEGQPEAVRMTFDADGTLVMEPVGGPVSLTIGEEIPISIRIGARTLPWQVVGDTLCVDGTGPGDCLPIRVEGDTLFIEDDGIPGRGTLVPV